MKLMQKPLSLFSAVLLASVLGHVGNATAASEVKAEGFISLDKLTPGANFRVAVVVELEEPWHINANPATTEGAIPTELNLRASDAITLKPPVYPRGKETK